MLAEAGSVEIVDFSGNTGEGNVEVPFTGELVVV